MTKATSPYLNEPRRMLQEALDDRERKLRRSATNFPLSEIGPSGVGDLIPADHITDADRREARRECVRLLRLVRHWAGIAGSLAFWRRVDDALYAAERNLEKRG